MFDPQTSIRNTSYSDGPRDLAVVTVSWNVKDLLANCLASVFESLSGSGLNAEVWAVDNASHDGSAEMVQERFPQVRLLVSDQNLGFASGNNHALRAIGFQRSNLPRYVLLLNPDTEVQDDALATMVRFMDETPSAGVCGARLLYGDGGFQHSAACLFDTFDNGRLQIQFPGHMLHVVHGTFGRHGALGKPGLHQLLALAAFHVGEDRVADQILIAVFSKHH